MSLVFFCQRRLLLNEASVDWGLCWRRIVSEVTALLSDLFHSVNQINFFNLVQLDLKMLWENKKNELYIVSRVFYC